MKFRILKNQLGDYKLEGRLWWWPFWYQAYRYKKAPHPECDWNERIVFPTLRFKRSHYVVKIIEANKERIDYIVQRHRALIERDKTIDTWKVVK